MHCRDLAITGSDHHALELSTASQKLLPPVLPSWQIKPSVASLSARCSRLCHPHWISNLQALSQLAMSAASSTLPSFFSACICGTRGVGKSSFARLLVNHLLSHAPEVAFLDLDCGQPELTVPGKHFWIRTHNSHALVAVKMHGCTKDPLPDRSMRGFVSESLVRHSFGKRSTKGQQVCDLSGLGIEADPQQQQAHLEFCRLHAAIHSQDCGCLRGLRTSAYTF